jgi:hypothetical protein
MHSKALGLPSAFAVVGIRGATRAGTEAPSVHAVALPTPQSVLAIVAALCLLLAVYVLPAYGAPVTVYPVVTTAEKTYANRDNNRERVRKIQKGIEDAARDIDFGPPVSTVERTTRVTPSAGGGSLWFRELVALISDLIVRVLRWLFDLLAAYVLSLVHNPNVASPYDRKISMYGVEVPYDLVGPHVKTGVRQCFVVMRALAVNLLLLLFVLTIWKYWMEAAWKNGQQLMGVVARLIATTGLIVFWPVISYHYVQISNEMIDYVFRSISAINIQLAIVRVSDAAARGGILYLFGSAFRFTGPLADATAGGLVGILGLFLSIFFFFPALYQLVHLIILKAIQTAIMLAQFMFAPMFLVFFATPDTEKIATGFIKSCVEVSLWTFAWAGLLRLVVVILASDERNVWGTFIMLLGIFQIMLQVPEFISHAQISHSSSFLTPLAALKGFSMLGRTLREAGGRVKDWYNGLGRGSDSSSLGHLGDKVGEAKLKTPGSDNGGGGSGSGGEGPKKKGPTPQGPSTGGTQGPGTSTNSPPLNTTGTANPTGAIPPSKNATNQKAHRKRKEHALANFANQLARGEVGEAHGDNSESTLHHDGERGVKGISYEKDASPEAEATARTIGAFAQVLMRNPAARAELAAALGWKPNEFSKTPIGIQKRLFDRQINEMAANGAAAFVNGEKGNVGTKMLERMFGQMTPDDRDEMLEGLMDPSLPHSPLHPNYGQNSQAVAVAQLKQNAATMAMAEKSQLRGEPLRAAYNALSGALGPRLLAEGHVPGTAGHTAALSRAILGASTEKHKAAAAAGIGLLGAPEADQPSTPEEWEAYVNETEQLAKTNGMRHDDAFGKLRGAISTPAARRDPRPLADKLSTAARAICGMREQKVPDQAMASENFVGQMYESSREGDLTGGRVLGALIAAKVVGYDGLGEADTVLAESMLDSQNGGWKAGEINAYTMGLAREVKAMGGTVGKRICERVVAAGKGINEMSVAAAQRSEFDAVNAPQAGFAIAAMFDAYEGSSMMDALREGGHDAYGWAAGEIKSLSSDTVRGYAALAREAPGTVYTQDIVHEAMGLASSGYGRVSILASHLHRAANSASTSGGHIDMHTAGVGLQHVIHAGFDHASWDNPDVLRTAAGFSPAELGSPQFMQSAGRAAVILPDAYTVDNIQNLQNMVPAIGQSVERVDRIEFDTYCALKKVDPNYAPSSQQLKRVAACGSLPTTLPALHATMHSGMVDINPTLAPVLTEGVIQYATAVAASRAGGPVTVESIATEIDRMPEEVVRACVVTQQQEGTQACTRLEFVDHLARSAPGRSIPSIHSTYKHIQRFVTADAAVDSPASCLGAATMNTVLHGNAVGDYRNLYHAAPGAGWADAAISVRQMLLEHGVKDIVTNVPAVAQSARACYEYNPALLSHFITALKTVGPDHANLGTAVLINDLKDHYLWTESQFSFSNLAIAEHLLVEGVAPYFDTVRNVDLTGLGATATGGSQALDANRNIVPAASGATWH